MIYPFWLTGVYPYSYFDNAEKFKETQLPPRESFYDELSKEECSLERYEHAVKVWDVFQLKTLGDLCDLYACSDALLLSAVFKQYREECYGNYGLDPLHYVSSPGNLTIFLGGGPSL